jgi:hypothetical protein
VQSLEIQWQNSVPMNGALAHGTPDEIVDETMKKEKEKFTESIVKLLGESFKYEDFSIDPKLEDLGTPSFEPYDNDGSRILPDAGL